MPCTQLQSRARPTRRITALAQMENWFRVARKGSRKVRCWEEISGNGTFRMPFFSRLEINFYRCRISRQELRVPVIFGIDSESFLPGVCCTLGGGHAMAFGSNEISGLFRLLRLKRKDS
ncbi:hypothetical protein JTE90_002329 [Oedothorax gibbosus]|uniref:Uncharacterized protein n=1 Tax=Oedothorax gibbosus TaxID=931172 RepID=A0AAV6UJP5_9ARAC|nr:hypothetical protein JTE90_002329 [Oedothorax gibbosus]